VARGVSGPQIAATLGFLAIIVVSFATGEVAAAVTMLIAAPISLAAITLIRRRKS
jgi:multisubunit Na+/H+ antiporter MnhG subunit